MKEAESICHYQNYSKINTKGSFQAKEKLSQRESGVLRNEG
jgi:hypothetical protein